MIVVSIAVVGEGLHLSTGEKVGKSIEREMQWASLHSSGMANIIRLVTHKGVSYYANPTLAETRALGDPGELIFDAKRQPSQGCRQQRRLRQQPLQGCRRLILCVVLL